MRRRAADLRAELPGYLCPEGFEPLADWLRDTDAPAHIWRAHRTAQVGAVMLRDVAERAVALARELEAEIEALRAAAAPRDTMLPAGPIGPWLLEV